MARPTSPLSVLVAVAALQLCAAAPAAGHHIPEGTYRGTHSGGGTVLFTVSGNGEEIRRLRITNLPGDGCAERIDVRFRRGQGMPVIVQAFSKSFVSDGLFFGGEFHARQRAKGRIDVSGCDARDLSWSARTGASAARSEECLDAKRQLRGWRRRLRNARRGVGRAHTPSSRRAARAQIPIVRRQVRTWTKRKRRNC